MPKTTDDRQDGSREDPPEDLPSTLERSDGHAQRTFAAARASAEETYHDAQRANRVAWAAVEHGHEKVGDHWEPKEGGRRGPSDAQAEGGAGTDRPTAGGVDAGATKAHLQDVARRLGVPGRSRMSKEELVEAIGRANDRATRQARERSS
ncbi:ChaB family protein [Quadrisphaera sp. DSM 44207]|uniref:ChaB family protein n=1 Tax=Quadrisphaera sp. DSM 44207 TaxID=1881057 RepID=UPI000B8A3043|nr:ChaB family protein [Quadrisphaera sp. DSM 44207]